MIELPDLSAAKIISLDLETKDPELLTRGCGGARGVGHIAGIAVGTEDGGRWYVPMRHEGGGENVDPEKALAWAREQLGRPHQTKIGANVLYDLEWLASEGCPVAGPFVDVQYAEALIDEAAPSYSLEAISNRHLGEGKVDDEIWQWLADHHGGKPTRKAQAGKIHLAPTHIAAPYAMGDVDLPLRIWEKQQKILKAEDLGAVADVEFRLIPLLLAMRMNGVRVDVAQTKKYRADWQQAVDTARRLIPEVDVWAAASIEQLFKHLKIAYPRTAPTDAHPDGQPSFTKGFINKCAKETGNKQVAAIATLRKYEKAIGTFLDGSILDMHHNGRIHCEFHPLRKEDYGAVSGRFSCSRPNLQFLPARDDEIGPAIRGLFLPDTDEHEWLCLDYSQIEYRLVAHYGIGSNAQKVRDTYIEFPDTDYHAMTSKRTGVSRSHAKNINFGMIYGMGEPALAKQLGIPLADAKPIFAQYHAEMPFIRELARLASNRAEARGYVRTLLGRRRRFTQWQSRKWTPGQKGLPYEEAVEKYGANLRRAYTHKALNAISQGSAADIIKLAMVKTWESGLCDTLGVPLVTVHDELGLSKPRGAAGDEAALELKSLMENVYPLSLPLIASMSTGDNWGECK